MKRVLLVNGKVTYPQGEGVITTFHFCNNETGENYSVRTTSKEETDELNYGDEVEVEITKKRSSL